MTRCSKRVMGIFLCAMSADWTRTWDSGEGHAGMSRGTRDSAEVVTPPLESSGARQSAGEIPQVNQFSYPDYDGRSVSRGPKIAHGAPHPRRRSRSQQQREGTTQIYQNVATLRGLLGRGIHCNARARN